MVQFGTKKQLGFATACHSQGHIWRSAGEGGPHSGKPLEPGHVAIQHFVGSISKVQLQVRSAVVRKKPWTRMDMFQYDRTVSNNSKGTVSLGKADWEFTHHHHYHHHNRVGTDNLFCFLHLKQNTLGKTQQVRCSGEKLHLENWIIWLFWSIEVRYFLKHRYFCLCPFNIIQSYTGGNVGIWMSKAMLQCSANVPTISKVDAHSNHFTFFRTSLTVQFVQLVYSWHCKFTRKQNQ